MSGFSVKPIGTLVLEAGGHIESRASYPDYRKFIEQYVFTKESLERFIEQIKQEQNNESA